MAGDRGECDIMLTGVALSSGESSNVVDFGCCGPPGDARIIFTYTFSPSRTANEPQANARQLPRVDSRKDG